MQDCDLTIDSVSNGEKKTYTLSGKMEISSFSVRLCYADEGAEVTIEANEKGVRIQRTGDYLLRLPLHSGEKTRGAIGVLGMEGSVDIVTDSLSHSVVDDCFSLLAEYALMFGSEEQKMELRLNAKLK